MSGRNGFETRVDANGYLEYRTNGKPWTKTHRRAAEKKYGELSEGKHIHHINGDKQDNSYSNLAYVTPAVHAKLHADPETARNRCFRCGREGHWASRCTYKTDFRGKRLND